MMDHPELRPVLTVAGGPMRGARFTLRPGALVIGRAPTVDIVVDDPHLSRRHAVVRMEGDTVFLNDLGSTNGTWRNDCRISGVEALSDGDVIRLGRTELRFFDPGLARTDPVGLSFGVMRRHQRPTLPLPVHNPPSAPVSAAPVSAAPVSAAPALPADPAPAAPATTAPVVPAPRTPMEAIDRVW